MNAVHTQLFKGQATVRETEAREYELHTPLKPAHSVRNFARSEVL